MLHKFQYVIKVILIFLMKKQHGFVKHSTGSQGTDVYQRIQLKEQENRRNIACRRRQTKITEVVLSLRILGNSLPILRKRRLSCMTDKSAVNSFSAIAH
ncbi:hypothetical protein L9F63_018248, partial [Diploptera punctata]